MTDGKSDEAPGVGDTAEETTVVVLPRQFFADSLRHLGGGLRGAAGICDESARMVESGAGPAALRHLGDELAELKATIEGAVRAHERCMANLTPQNGGTHP